MMVGVAWVTPIPVIAFLVRRADDYDDDDVIIIMMRMSSFELYLLSIDVPFNLFLSIRPAAAEAGLLSVWTTSSPSRADQPDDPEERIMRAQMIMWVFETGVAVGRKF